MPNEICRKFCVYFREDKEDTGHCRPVLVAGEAGFDPPADGDHIFLDKYPELKKIFCEQCEFHPADCDFHDPAVKGMPCGGYVYFEWLLEKGETDIEGIERLCQTVR